MKRILFALFLAISTIALGTSCTKEYYEIPTSKSFIYTVNANDWQSSSTGLLKTLVLPELDRIYMETGTVQVAISEDEGGLYNIIPATYDAIAYSVSYTTGSVTIYIEDPILGKDTFVVPNKLRVKVTLTDAVDRT